MINNVEKLIFTWFVKSKEFCSLSFIGQVTLGVLALLIQPRETEKKSIFFFPVNRFLLLVNFLIKKKSCLSIQAPKFLRKRFAQWSVLCSISSYCMTILKYFYELFWPQLNHFNHEELRWKLKIKLCRFWCCLKKQESSITWWQVALWTNEQFCYILRLKAVGADCSGFHCTASKKFIQFQ